CPGRFSAIRKKTYGPEHGAEDERHLENGIQAALLPHRTEKGKSITVQGRNEEPGHGQPEQEEKEKTHQYPRKRPWNERSGNRGLFTGNVDGKYEYDCHEAR